MALERKDIPRPTLRKEAMHVPEWNGEVFVQSLLLRERFELATAEEQTPFARIAQMLARCVVDANGEQVYTADEWEIWGAEHQDSTIALWQKAKELAGLGEEKNEQAQS